MHKKNTPWITFKGCYIVKKPVFWQDKQAVKKGLESAKLAKQRRNAIHFGMRSVGVWGFCRLSDFIDSLTPLELHSRGAFTLNIISESIIFKFTQEKVIQPLNHGCKLCAVGVGFGRKSRFLHPVDDIGGTHSPFHGRQSPAAYFTFIGKGIGKRFPFHIQLGIFRKAI